MFGKPQKPQMYSLIGSAWCFNMNGTITASIIHLT